jgi:DNA modification methylase
MDKLLWDIDKLHEWDKNPRTISKENFERLKNQIKELGEYKPLLITKDGTVLGGNMRLKAYRELGYKKVWVSIVEANTEEEKIKYALSDNDQLGEYQKDDLANLVGSFPDLDLSNFTIQLDKPKPLGELIDEFKEVVEDEVPEVEEGEPKSKLGEVYQLGRHRLMCGDATKREDVERLMNGKKADMVFTDPPYNVNYEGSMNTYGRKNTKPQILNDNLGDKFINFLRDVISNMMEACDGSFYICMSSKELGNLKSVFEEAGGHWQSFIIWVKNNFTLSRADYQQLYEPILYGWKKDGKHYFIQDRDKGNVWEDLSKVKTEYDGEYTTISFQGFKVRIKGKVAEGQVIRKHQKVDIWRYDKPIKSEEHPTMKPVALCGEAIKNSSKKDDIVLDLFGGSGSTLIACEQTNRICYMMELDPHYCDVIRKRYANFIGKKDQWETITPKI